MPGARRHPDPDPVTVSARLPTTRRRPAAATARTLLVELAAPLLLYYGLHAWGVSDVVALVAGAVPAAAGTVVSAVRGRRIEPVSAAMFAMMVLGLLATVISGNPRQLLARGAWLSAPAGIWTLGTLLRGLPMCSITTRAILPGRAAVMDRLWATEPSFRQAWRSITAVWGSVLLADSGVRVWMAYTLPVPSVPALDTTLTIASVVLLQLPTHLLLRRSGCWDLLFRVPRPRRDPESPLMDADRR